MAATTRTSAPALINDLLHNGHRFSFVQVMRLMRVLLGPGALDQGRVRVRPELSLAFPASDVARIEPEGVDGAGFLVTATFMGLYGSASPLPTFYTEDLMEEDPEDSAACRAFLDIIHQRLYSLYFHCWCKYRMFIRVEEEQDRGEREKLLCLAGLGEQGPAEWLQDAWSLARYIGLLTMFPRSAVGLETLLRDAMGMDRISVIQCIRRNVPIPPDQRMRIGMANCRLGVDTFLGKEVVDRSGKFRIRIGTLTKSEFDSFLPGASRREQLAALVRMYVTTPLEFDLELVLAAGEAEPIRLGDSHGPRMGWNMWCFSGDRLGEVSAVYPLSRK
jgi:type VI secretion system protein ImpH